MFKLALPNVGVLDRYHTFTAGAGWAYDYGTSVQSNVKYPETLVLTGDHDDRVLPAHSFKFAAGFRPNR